MTRYTRRYKHRGGGFKNTMRRVCKGMSCMGNSAVPVTAAAAAPTPANKNKKFSNNVNESTRRLNRIHNEIKSDINRMKTGHLSKQAKAHAMSYAKTKAAHYTALKNMHNALYTGKYTRKNYKKPTRSNSLRIGPRLITRTAGDVLRSGRNVFENFKPRVEVPAVPPAMPPPAPTMRIAKGAFNHVNSLTNNELNEIRGYTAVPAVPANEHEPVNESEPEHPEPGPTTGNNAENLQELEAYLESNPNATAAAIASLNGSRTAFNRNVAKYAARLDAALNGPTAGNNAPENLQELEAYFESNPDATAAAAASLNSSRTAFNRRVANLQARFDRL